MRDAGIISAGQKAEHYEIASYGTLRQFAENSVKACSKKIGTGFFEFMGMQNLQADKNYSGLSDGTYQI